MATETRSAADLQCWALKQKQQRPGRGTRRRDGSVQGEPSQLLTTEVGGARRHEAEAAGLSKEHCGRRGPDGSWRKQRSNNDSETAGDSAAVTHGSRVCSNRRQRPAAVATRTGASFRVMAGYPRPSPPSDRGAVVLFN